LAAKDLPELQDICITKNRSTIDVVLQVGGEHMARVMWATFDIVAEQILVDYQ
jgi:hypothetical protein